MNGHTYLITGGASGIGLATARTLAAQGAKLALWDRDAAALETAARELSAIACVVDVTDEAAVAAALRDTLSASGGSLNGVIHSAGVLRTGRFETVEPSAYRRMVEINLFGTINIAHAAFAALKAARGSLILLGSVSSYYGGAEFSVYGATKAAVLNLGQSLRIEWAEYGIHVGVVSPHFTETPMLAEARRTPLVGLRSPFTEVCTPEQIATAIVRGIEQRAFMIYPSWRSALIFHVSRYADAIAGRLMAQAWHDARRQAQSR